MNYVYLELAAVIFMILSMLILLMDKVKVVGLITGSFTLAATIFLFVILWTHLEIATAREVQYIHIIQVALGSQIFITLFTFFFIFDMIKFDNRLNREHKQVDREMEEFHHDIAAAEKARKILSAK